MSEVSITITNNNMKQINKLISFIPDNFSFVPMVISKDENGKCNASVKTIEVNGNIVFSGNIGLTDNITELENEQGIAIRLPINKNIINTVFNSNCDSIEISKTKIKLNKSNVKMSITMLELLPNDLELVDFPINNIEIFNTAIENNDSFKKEYALFNIESDKIKELVECVNILTPAKNDDLKFNLISKKNNLYIKCEDYIKNNFEYSLDIKSENKFDSFYDYTLINTLQKLMKFKDYIIEILVSDAIIVLSLNDEEMEVSIGIPAGEE